MRNHHNISLNQQFPQKPVQAIYITYRHTFFSRVKKKKSKAKQKIFGFRKDLWLDSNFKVINLLVESVSRVYTYLYKILAFQLIFNFFSQKSFVFSFLYSNSSRMN